MPSHGMRLLASLIASEGGLQEFVSMDLRPVLFSGVEKDVFAFVREHLSSHGALPAAATVQEETGHALPQDAPEPPQFYLGKLTDRYAFRTIKQAVEDAKEPLNKGDIEVGVQILGDAIMALQSTQQRKRVINLKEELWRHVKQQYAMTSSGVQGLQTGWPYLDDMTNGLLPGDLMAYVGRPATGKTFFTLYGALHGWRRQQRSVLFVSMEMPAIEIETRLAAMYAKVPLGRLERAELATKTYKERLMAPLQALPDSDLPPFWLVDGNLAVSVDDIVMYCRQFKPSAVYVDGAYMLKTRGNSRWERIAESCEDLKRRVSGNLETPVVASYQFNREMTKVKKGEQVGTEHIAGADEIGKIASVVLGCVDHGEKAKTKEGRTISIIKGRKGQVGSFRVNWVFDDWPFMDFSQVVEKKPEDIEYG